MGQSLDSLIVETDAQYISSPQTLGKDLHERQDGILNIDTYVKYVIIYFPLAFPGAAFAGYLFDMP